jgi:rubrerythrin
VSNQENPTTEDLADEETERPGIEFGDSLYTEDGVEVGIVQGIDEGRVIVSLREGAEVLGLERHQKSGQSFGEAELMWRCMNCGEMGEIEDGLPEECPNCGVEKEELMYWTED